MRSIGSSLNAGEWEFSRFRVGFSGNWRIYRRIGGIEICRKNAEGLAEI